MFVGFVPFSEIGFATIELSRFFVLANFPNLNIYSLSRLLSPVAVSEDLTQLVGTPLDLPYVSSYPSGKLQGNYIKVELCKRPVVASSERAVAQRILSTCVMKLRRGHNYNNMHAGIELLGYHIRRRSQVGFIKSHSMYKSAFQNFSAFETWKAPGKFQCTYCSTQLCYNRSISERRQVCLLHVPRTPSSVLTVLVPFATSGEPKISRVAMALHAEAIRLLVLGARGIGGCSRVSREGIAHLSTPANVSWRCPTWSSETVSMSALDLPEAHRHGVEDRAVMTPGVEGIVIAQMDEARRFDCSEDASATGNLTRVA